MYKIYSNPSEMMVHHVKNLLEERGIECVVRGEHLASASGGVAPIDAWVELWVVDEDDLDEAREVVEEVKRDQEEASAWTCPECGEQIEAVFDTCWNCGAEQPET